MVEAETATFEVTERKATIGVVMVASRYGINWKEDYRLKFLSTRNCRFPCLAEVVEHVPTPGGMAEGQFGIRQRLFVPLDKQ